MKRLLSAMLSLLIVLGTLSSGMTAWAAGTTKTKSRLIHVVYDDSGSMASRSSTSWSQAKYALEVFAAMMGEEDRLTIYPMSSFSYKDKGGKQKSDSWGKTLTVKGSDSASERVETINKMNGDQGQYRNTPIQTVETAGKDLQGDSAGEKWLVVLTDGAFDRGMDGTGLSAEEIKKGIQQYAGKDDIRVAYVAIGEALSLTAFPKENFYPYDAKNKGILDTVTEVATTVFNYQTMPSLTASENSYSFSADIPISKLIVFAQGDNVTVDNLSRSGGEKAEATASVDVSVPQDTQYKPQNTGSYYPEIKVADGLKGKVVTYAGADEKQPLASGSYSFGCNTKNVQVYFEPGVDIQSILVDDAGNEINLSQSGAGTIEAGRKKLLIRLIDPLTGEVIDEKASKLLDGIQKSMLLTDENGNETTVREGEEVTIPEGGIEIVGKVTFKGDIEKTSTASSLTVEPAKLQMQFLSDKGYTLNPGTLETSEPVMVQVRAGDGTVLSAEEYAALKLEVAEMQGLRWNVDAAEESGTYVLTPEFAGENGPADVPSGSPELRVDASIESGGIQRKGSGITKINVSAEGIVELQLTMETPEPSYEDGKNPDKKYMFDCNERGASEGAPYILVTAAVAGCDGTTRPLNEQEWEHGVKGFQFSARSVDSNLLWKLIRVVCGQRLEFEVHKGSENSTYRLYLGGMTPAGVLPNTSELTATLKIKLGNGLLEEGSCTDEVSVKPANVLVYIGWLLLVIAVILLLLILLIMELNKPRFPKDMFPNTYGVLRRAGRPIVAPAPVSGSKGVKYRFWPPMRAEERDIVMKYPGYMVSPITFHCKAVGHGSFVITNVKKFANVKSKVSFNGNSYEEMLESPQKLSIGSTIDLRVEIGVVKGTISMVFRKQK